MMLLSKLKTRAFPVGTSILLLLSWICAVVSLGVGSALLAGHYSTNAALHKMGFAIGLASTILLFPPTLYSILRTRNNGNLRPGRTAFLRWHGTISWLFSTAIIATTSIILAQAQRITPNLICASQQPTFRFYHAILFCQDLREHRLDQTIVVLCLLLGIFLHLASLLIFCKPRQEANDDDTSSLNTVSTQAVSIKSAMAYLEKLPEYRPSSTTPIRAHSIPRKRVDYLAYTYDVSKMDDEETQIGHQSPTPSHEVMKGDQEKDTKNKNDSQWTCQILPKPYKARIVTATSPTTNNKIKTQSYRNFQSLDGASLAVRNSI